MHLQIIEKSNCAEVEIKHGSTRYTVVIGNQFSCDRSWMQKPNGNTSYHIVWVLLNLMQVGEGNYLIAQVEIGHCLNANAFKGANRNSSLSSSYW